MTNGGLTGVQEALLRGLPVLTVPVFADQVRVQTGCVCACCVYVATHACVRQWDVGQRVANAGAGLVVDAFAATERSVGASAEAVLSNRSFASAAARLRTLLSAGGGAKEAAALIELAQRLGDELGAALEHGASLPLYRAYLLDVYAVYGCVLGALALLLRSCWSGCLAVLAALKAELAEGP